MNCIGLIRNGTIRDHCVQRVRYSEAEYSSVGELSVYRWKRSHDGV